MTDKKKQNLWRALLKIAILVAGLVGGAIGQKATQAEPVANEIINLL